MKKYLLLSTILLGITIYFIIINPKTEMALTYFPIDDEEEFIFAESHLRPIDQSNKIKWISESTSETKLYLRQDVSLLFKNGSLQGILNKWAQNVDNIKQVEQVNISPNSLLQTISFHHGEHHHDEKITSIQKMSNDSLYVFQNKIIRKAKSAREEVKISSLNEKVRVKLTTHWDSLINHFEINSKNYVQVPLIEIKNLHNYFPHSFSKKSKDRIFGQLWEGLYKNYVLQAVETRSKDLMPLILLANDFSHLIILYSMNGEETQLIQQINIENNEST